MKIKELRACFGVLNNKTLKLGDGLNIIQAPNEGGKSTWSAFLRAMLYGINTKERDKQGYIAEKNRYQPWSGSAMEGSIDLVWRGREITLRRGPKGSTPFGKFEAVYTATGEPVPELTGDNTGELLIGAPREVFERSAFVGQGGAVIDGAPALETRIAALASSGEEDVSYSLVERRLKDWRNRRQHNRTGLIPKGEEELAVLEGTLARQAKAHRLSEEARRELDDLSREKALLEQEMAVHRARQQGERRRKYEAAQAELAQAQAETEAIHNQLTLHGTPPGREELRHAQEELNYLNTLRSNAQLAQRQLEEAAQAAGQARAAAADEAFVGLSPDEAWARASADEAGFRRGRDVSIPVGVLQLLAGAAFAAVIALLRPDMLWLTLLGGAVAVCGIAVLAMGLGRKKKHARRDAEVLARYGVTSPDGILKRANDYRERCVLADQAEKRTEAVEQSLAQLTAQQEELTGQLLEFVHGFAPTVSDAFGVSAAISRTLGLEEKLAVARTRLEGARRLAESLPVPETVPEADLTVEPRFDLAETAARQTAAEGELARLRSAQAMAQGERNSMGDPALLQNRQEELREALQRRREEHQALTLALEGLERANSRLQERFSPALNRRAGEIFAALTGGKYEKVTLTRQFEALGEEAGGLTPRRAITLSQGTVDQLYLAVRLAVCELTLPEEELAPLVLDDALVSFDDERAALALDYLAEEKRQILLFTCHSREAAWAAGRKNVTIVPLHSEAAEYMM